MDPTITDISDEMNITDALSCFDKSAIKRLLKERIRPNIEHLPSSKGMPIFGHMYWFATNSRKWLRDQHAQFGPVFKFRVFNQEVVFLLGPEANRLIFQNEGKGFSNYLGYGPTIKNLLDDNVLALDFKHHKTTRKTLQAAFKRQAVEGHIELMNPMIQTAVAKWPANRTVKSTELIRKLLLDTAAKVFLGLDIGPDADMMNQAFVDLLAGGASFIRAKWIPFFPYAKALKARKNMEHFIYRNINNRRNSEKEGLDIFSQICNAKDEDGEYFSDEEICNQTIFLLFAAHDTTASALSSTFYALASNQEWQEELRQEILAMEKKDLNFEDFDKLTNIGYTLQESLRMYPPVPLFPRYSLSDFELAGHHIPANTPVMGSAVFTHYMSEHWTNPYTYDPMRFSPERAEYKNDFYQYVPFGGGAHKCLGLHFAQVQGKMFLYNLLKNYKITKNPKMTKFKHNNFPLTFPTDRLPLKFNKI